jgi:diguanylate cyclase (GGDEF)-like protein
MSIDIHTTIMIAAIMALLVGVSLHYVLRDYPASLAPSIRLWLLGTLLQPTAWMLYSMRDEVPDWCAAVLANALLSLAYALQIKGIRIFLERPLRRSLVFAPVAAVAVLEIVFTYVVPSIRLRLVTVSAVFCVQLIVAIIALLDWNQPRRRSHLLTASAFVALAAILVVRVAYEGLREGTIPSAFAATWMQTAVFGLAAFFPTIATLGFVLMCSDRLYQELERQAAIDMLTGVSNRRTLDLQASRAIALAHRHKRPLSLLLIDADHFKRINDVYGHEAGDEALQTLAAVLQCSLRGEDLFARLGGEEFVAVLPETDEEAARASAERLRVAVEQAEFTVQHRRVPLRVSIGISVVDNNDDFAGMLRRADQAMYAAKRAGRNRVFGPADAPRGPVLVEGNFAG